MEKFVKIISLKDKSSDFEFWSTKTESERLEAVEMLRNQYIQYTQNVQQGFQIVCRVINQKQS